MPLDETIGAMSRQHAMNAGKPLGLYVNVLLTGEAVWAKAGAAPLYPRRCHATDTNRKEEVLDLSLTSIRDLPIEKIILNIEATKEYDGAPERLFARVRELFPRAEVHREPKRPTNLHAWMQSTTFAEKVFGPTMPVICFFNHDHIFVDYRPEPFLRAVETVFSAKDNRSAFLGYSHAPETISLIFDHRASLVRLWHVNGLEPGIMPPVRQAASLYKCCVKGSIDGIFVTTTAGLRYLWSNAIMRESYTPRPDWKGVSFPGVLFDVYLTGREFFRHFDGYGHVTSLREGFALSLEQLGGQPRAAMHVPPVYRHQTPCDDIDLETEARSYVSVFMDLCSLAARDAMFADRIGHSVTGSHRGVVERLYTLFDEAYLSSEGEGSHRTAAQWQELRSLVTHYVFSSVCAFEQDLLADTHLWFQRRARPGIRQRLCRRAGALVRSLTGSVKHLWPSRHR